MFRTVPAILTTLGLLACPFVCKDGGNWLTTPVEGAVQETSEAFVRAESSCCGGHCHNSRFSPTGKGPSAPYKDECDCVCLCKGALGVFHKPEVAPLQFQPGVLCFPQSPVSVQLSGSPAASFGQEGNVSAGVLSGVDLCLRLSALLL